MLKELKNNISGKEAQRKTLFSIERNSNNHLVVNFEAYSSSLKSYSNKHNDSLWEGNVVEIFFALDDSPSYYELEVAPNGATFVGTILNREITYIDDSFLKVEVKTKDDTYFVKMDIDLNLLGNPKKIEYNIFRIEVVNKKQLLMAYNPTLCGTFHVRDKFVLLKI